MLVFDIEAPEANAFFSNDPPPTIAAADAIVAKPPPPPPPLGKATPATPLTSIPAFLPISPIALPNNSCPIQLELIRLHFAIRLRPLTQYQN